MAPLSPAAQAVKDAFDSQWAGTRNRALIAALRALADAVVPEENNIVTVNDFRRQRQHTRKEILAIATELENREH